MKMNKMTLLYGFDESEINKITMFSAKDGHNKIKIINDDMAEMTLAEILKGSEPKDEHRSLLPSEKVIIFNESSDKEIEKSFEFIKSEFKPLPIMAVVTETSANWTFKHLLEHLIEEKIRFMSGIK